MTREGRLLAAIEQALAELEMEFHDKAYDTLTLAYEAAKAAPRTRRSRPAPTPRRRK